MSKQHSALLLPAVGAPFEIGKRATPTPGPGQVLIRNKAVGNNPVDGFMQATGFQISPHGFPAVVGGDGAGEIAVLGEGVKNVKIGDRVLYQSAFDPDRGTFQELTIADAERVAKIPSNLSYEEAATVPLTLATAAIGAYKEKSDVVKDGHSVGGAGLTPPWEAGGRGKYAGKAVLILGGSSSVGRFAIQLAKLSGFSIIVTTASKHNEAYVKDAGATHFIDYKEVPYAELPGAVKKLVGDTPLTYVYDAISVPDSQKAGWEVLVESGGALVLVLPPSPDVGKPGTQDGKGRYVVSVFGTVNDSENWAFGKNLYAELPGLLEKGDLHPISRTRSRSSDMVLGTSRRALRGSRRA